MIAALVCVAIAVAMLLIPYFGLRRAAHMLAGARLILDQAKELNDNSSKMSGEYEKSLSLAAEMHERLVAMAAREKKRAEDFFSIIEGIEGEAQTWRNLYRRDMASANAAQAWLLRELNAAVTQGNRYAKELQTRGVKVRDISVSDELKAVVVELSEKGTVLPKEVATAPGKAAAAVIEENYQLAESGKGA